MLQKPVLHIYWSLFIFQLKQPIPLGPKTRFIRKAVARLSHFEFVKCIVE